MRTKAYGVLASTIVLACSQALAAGDSLPNRSVLSASIATPMLVQASGSAADIASESMFWACNACAIEKIETTAALHGSGTHLVYDLPGNALYRNRCETAEGTGTHCNASPQVSGEVYERFVRYRALWSENAESETYIRKLDVDLPSSGVANSENAPVDDGFVNAFDTMTTSHFAFDVTQYIEQATRLSIDTIEPSRDGLTYVFQEARLVVNVTFHHRSTRVFRLVERSGGAFEAVADTAWDSSGNRLPEKLPVIYQSYTFYDNPRGYDPSNLILLLQPASLAVAKGGCRVLRWDTAKVDCEPPH